MEDIKKAPTRPPIPPTRWSAIVGFVTVLSAIMSQELSKLSLWVIYPNNVARRKLRIRIIFVVFFTTSSIQ